MKLHCILPSAIGMTLILVACEKEIDFRYHDISPLTVIEAELTPYGAKVGITLTTPMDEPMDRQHLTDATVTLTDLTDGTISILDSDEAGYFVSRTPGITGHDYRLKVERNGCCHVAEARMYAPTEIKSAEFNWIKMPYDHVAVFKGQFLDNKASEGDCYWVKLYRNGKIYRWGEIDDRNSVDGVSTYLTMTTRRDTDKEDENTILLDGDTITFSVAPISLSMHNYLEALQNDSNGPEMFSGDKCLGYFVATSTVSESIVFHPDSMPEYK